MAATRAAAADVGAQVVDRIRTFGLNMKDFLTTEEHSKWRHPLAGLPQIIGT